jgi:hypothetical protein
MASLADWTGERIDAECEAAYEGYFSDVRRRHIAYFAQMPERRSDRHPFAARSREAALPEGWEHLARVLPFRAWHRHHLSGGSSQMLAVALLAAAVDADRSLRWMPGGRRLGRPLTLFEVELASTVLNERPRQTSIDWLVLDRNHVVAAEAKFTEKGLGRCSCELRDVAQCSERVRERPYWSVASRDMALTPGGASCSLSLAYQGVRNVAAAQGIAGRRHGRFLLLYDARNPYFVGASAWPGWIPMLARLMANSRTTFASLSWQELLRRVGLDPWVKQWAVEKHGLVPN